MRKLAVPVLTLSLTLALVGLSTARADNNPDFDGTWKLVYLTVGDYDLLIFDLKTTDGKTEGTVRSAHPIFAQTKTADVDIKGNDIKVSLPTRGQLTVFQGTLKDGKVLGSLLLGDSPNPARLEKTDARQVGQATPSPALARLSEIQRETDARRKVDRLRDLIHENVGHPLVAQFYGPLLMAADSAKLSAGDVRGIIETWAAEAKPYGPIWSTEVQSRALKAIQGKKAYAALCTELAQAAEKDLPADASLETRGEIASILARSARLAGKNDLASAAESRLKEIDAKLDADYHEKVPPFKPATYTGRKGGTGTRAVVMEIFTGAQCPPCVAADVGFDALLTTYKPTEFIGLQYHLHIPGPDPLTNTETIARQEYYGTEVRGTPSTFFNGKSAAGGGGGMQGSENKYNQFRDLIDPALETDPKADITVTAIRNGDKIKIDAKASAKKDAASKDARPRLRLVLVETSVRYTGGNKLRFHHNVVRALPGGIEGQPLDDGKAEVSATVNLSDLRKSLTAYLDAYPESGPRARPFPNPLPPIDLNGLAVVAFVQDDADHEIWQGVQVPVNDVNP